MTWKARLQIRGMLRVSSLLLIVPLVSSVLSAQSSVWAGETLLTEAAGGWRVNFPYHPAGLHSLQSGDLIIKMDDKSAEEIGPLAVNLIFNDARDRTVPVVVRREGKLLSLGLCLSGVPKPTVKTASTLSAVSMSHVAPDFKLTTMKGVPVELSALRGRWVLISFWATWCGPCKEEARRLMGIRADLPAVRVLALSVGDSRENLEKFAAEVKPTYDLVDAGTFSSQPALAYGVGTPAGGASVPITVLVRPDGNIAYVQTGFARPSFLEEQLKNALAERSH